MLADLIEIQHSCTQAGLDRLEPQRGWKMTFFEGGIHVPFFLRWPDRIKAGTTIDNPVHHFDIFSTAAAAGKASVPSDRKMDGVNLLPYILGNTGSPVLASDKDPHEKLFWRSGGYQVVLSDGWKLQRSKRLDKAWLFNMKTDPTEQNNVAGEYPDRVTAMNAMLDKHNAEQVEPAWPAMIEVPRRVDKTIDEKFSQGDEVIYWTN